MKDRAPSVHILAIRDFVQQHQIIGGRAWSGYIIHFWKDGIPYCGNSHLVRREHALWSWVQDRLCQKCLKKLEELYLKEKGQ